jgi:molybdopterin/thiamine biosynthesis adenylyltransferase
MLMRVMVVGAGATGSPLVWGLTQLPWVTEITVADADVVARSNLPRQPWFGEGDLGLPKAARLAQQLGDPSVHAIGQRVDEQWVWPAVDVIMDATDTWQARRVIEAHARRQGIPWVFASAWRWEGQVAWMAPDGPCLQCLFGEQWLEGPRCFEAGVVGAVTLAVSGQALALLEQWHRDPCHRDLQALWLVDGWEGRSWPVRWSQARCRHGIG